MKPPPCAACYDGQHAACRDGDYDVGDDGRVGDGWCCCGHLRGWVLPPLAEGS